MGGLLQSLSFFSLSLSFFFFLFLVGLETTLKCQGKQVVPGTPPSMKVNLVTKMSAPRLGRWLSQCPEGGLYDLRVLGMFAAAKPRCPIECLFHF